MNTTASIRTARPYRSVRRGYPALVVAGVALTAAACGSSSKTA